MAISLSSVVHYTQSMDNLLSIMKNGFKPRHCKETLYCVSDSEKPNEKYPHTIFVPMVSFCDTPLKEAVNFMNYGSYAIGLTKEWAYKNSLNPVFYMEPNSPIGQNDAIVGKAITHFLYRRRQDRKTNSMNPRITSLYDLWGGDLKLDPHKDFEIIFKQLLRYRCFTKNYKGPLERKKSENSLSSYLFYDEREWRYIIDRPDLIFGEHVPDVYKEYVKEKLEIENHSINFELNDITYLIVKDEKEISDFIQKIHSTLKDTNHKSEELYFLYSKITTIERIKSDF